MKRRIRAELLRKRDAIRPADKKEKEKEIRRRLYRHPDFRRANRILFYVSFRSEVDTMLCLKHALDTGKKIVLPRVNGRKNRLDIYEIHDLSELEPGFIGILEPDTAIGRKAGLKDIDLVIMPGAGFDEEGNRLGYGHGYYDKLLSGDRERIPTIALAFERQIVSAIPTEPHDVGVDRIITEKRVIECKKKRSKNRDSALCIK